MAYTPSTVLQQVEALYIGYFGRAGEPGGVQYWVNQINNGQTFAQAAAAFSVQAEAKAQHPYLATPGLVSPADFVESLYTQIYGRASDATGKAYWVAQITASNGNPFSIGLLVAQFISGAQGDDIAVITNKVAAAEYFTGKLAAAGISGVDDKGQVTPTVDQNATDIIKAVTKDTASVTAANTKSDAFASTGGTPPSTEPLVLTDKIGEVKTGTAGADTFSGILAGAQGADGTYNLGDALDGLGGSDTFNLLVTAGATAPIGNTVKNIEIINVTHAGTSGALALTSADFAGVQQLWQIDNTNGTNDFQNVTVGTGVTAGFRSTGSATTAADVTAGTTVTAASATQTSIAVAFDGVDAASSVTLVGAGLTTASITGHGVTVGGTIGVVGVANIETVNLKADGTANTTFNLTTFGGVKTVDASTSTGALTTDLTGFNKLATYKGSAVAETVTFDLEDGQAVTVTMGAGNDKAVLNGSGTAATNFASTIALGDGKDTLDVDALTNIRVATKADFESGIITVSDFKVADDVLDISTLTGSTVLNNTQLDNIKGAASLFDAVTLAASTIGANQNTVFNFGGNLYVYANDAQAAFDAGDGLIRVTGVQVEQLNAQNFVA